MSLTVRSVLVSLLAAGAIAACGQSANSNDAGPDGAAADVVTLASDAPPEADAEPGDDVARVNCSPASVNCTTAQPVCDAGQWPSVEGTCWGPCVPSTQCMLPLLCAPGSPQNECPDGMSCNSTARPLAECE